MSDPQTDSHSPAPTLADPSDSIRAEVEREYAAKLAKAEFRAQAAQEGASVPEGFVEYLDASKLLGEDGWPSAEIISHALEPYKPKKPQLPQLMGAGYHQGPSRPFTPRVSLDIRKR
ncbi:hypothetical protein [Streptomyces aureoversilis]|uniref:Uncharacterized protein n=1 Tax=Streptomyces aureoversilis TaxID=67277 RepID=A0ABW0A2W3_9ACTN